MAHSCLTYRPREGIVVGVVEGRPFRLTALQNHVGLPLEAWRAADRSGGTTASHISPWDSLQEFRPGKWTTVGERLTIAANAKFETFDYPGEYAQRFDGVRPAGGQTTHRHHARVVWVKSAGRQAFPIHGLPPCGDPRCIVVVQGWDVLFSALKSARQVSLVVEI